MTKLCLLLSPASWFTKSSNLKMGTVYSSETSVDNYRESHARRSYFLFQGLWYLTPHHRSYHKVRYAIYDSQKPPFLKKMLQLPFYEKDVIKLFYRTVTIDNLHNYQGVTCSGWRLHEKGKFKRKFFWTVISYTPVNGYKYFGRTCCLHGQWENLKTSVSIISLFAGCCW
jgi:hypothetical protein